MTAPTHDTESDLCLSKTTFLTDQQRKDLLDELAREAQEMGLYDNIALVITDNTKPS